MSAGNEKFRPQYNLEAVQKIGADPNSQPFTVTALRGGLALGLKEPDMRRVVAELSPRNFYKSMPTNRDHRFWQDVYHGETPDGIAVYIKITHYPDGSPPVIQFKAK
jgi:motility quorum-sensing regulator / GCU-specific mRNA interferase toxin